MLLVQKAARFLQKKLSGRVPKISFVLGSGQANVADLVENPIEILYKNIPGFPEITVEGHKPILVAGEVAGLFVLFLKGRTHLYESLDFEPIKHYIRVLQALGTELLFLTNASGSLRVDIKPGELMMITDHINFIPGNPLVGPNNVEFGPRFLAMDQAYDATICKQIRRCAGLASVTLKEGVYLAVLGPNYETAAEIKAFRTLGADAVGMSTVSEVLVARHCGLKVAAIATITNYGTGLSHATHVHEMILTIANQAIDSMKKIISTFIEHYLHAN